MARHRTALRLTVRPIRPEDEEMLKRFLAKIDSEDLRLRFFVPVKEFGHALFPGSPSSTMSAQSPSWLFKTRRSSVLSDCIAMPIMNGENLPSWYARISRGAGSVGS